MTVHSLTINSFRSWPLALLIAGSLSLLALVALFASRPTTAAPLEITQTTSEADLVTRTNLERQAYRLSTLTWDAELYQAAQAKAGNMLSEQYFDHISPTGTTPWEFIHGAGYTYESAGENLAVGFTQNDRVVKAWMDSPTHRANVLDAEFSEIAIAEAHGTIDGQEVTVVVQMFGDPK